MAHAPTKRRLRIRYLSAPMIETEEGAIPYQNAKPRGCIAKVALGLCTVGKGCAIGLAGADLGVCCSLCNSCSNPSCHSCEGSKPEDLNSVNAILIVLCIGASYRE